MFNLIYIRYSNKIAILLLATLCFQNLSFASNRLTIKDKMMGPTLKTLARMYVAVTNINHLKKTNIKRISKMNEEKFNKKYAKVYLLLQELPEGLKAEYNVTEKMSKEQAIKTIDSLNKRKIYKIIAAVPNKFISRQYRKYIDEKRESRRKKNNYAKEVDNLWKEATAKADELTPDS